MRLDKFLCEMNFGSRSQVKELIRQSKVKVNGVTVRNADLKMNETKDQVTVEEKKIFYEKYVYYMLNKPKGVVSASRDRTAETVLDLIDLPEKKNLFPVGRLDKDTEGLLIITNDGELAHNLLSPKKHVDKVYLVSTREPLDEEQKKLLEAGVDIGDEKPTAPAKAKILSSNLLELTIHEGRFHQVKRMLAAVGNEVTELKRVKFGKIVLDDLLKPGESRKLTREEVELLK